MTNNLAPSGNLLLEQLGINPNNLRADFPSREQRLQYRAVVQWLTDYKPKSDTTNLEKVKGYLEAFYHLSKVGDWQRGCEILSVRLDTPTNDQLHRQLELWGYYDELIHLYSITLSKINADWDFISLSGLGAAYYSLGDYLRAMEYFEQSLTIARKIGNIAREGKALGNLGTVYNSLRDHSQAIKCHQQSLEIARKLSDRAEEARALSNIGIIHYSKENYHQGIKYHQQSLAIARELSNRALEVKVLNNLFDGYYFLGNYSEASYYYQQSRNIAQEIGERRGKGKALGSLGLLSASLKDYNKAISFFHEWLSIARKIGARAMEGKALGNLGNVYYCLGNYHQAVDYYQQRSVIAEELGDRTLALEYCDRALSIATELGIPLAQECQELKEKLLSEQT